MSQTATNPSELDPPPPYERIWDESISVGRNGWLYIKETPMDTGFWTKNVSSDPSARPASYNDIARIQCGISRYGVETGEPECIFMCSLLPRTSKIQKESIANLCGGIAWGARTHRGLSPEYCECTFQDLRRGVRCDKGGRWFFRFLDRFMAWKVRRWMERHDKICGCNCFDTPVSSGGLPLYTKS